jgi:ribosome-binding factor A
LAGRLDLRQTPELIFEQDDSIEHLSRIDTILKGIHIPEDQDDEQDE